MATVYISLGSNIDPEDNLRSAVGSLKHFFTDLIISPVYQSPAVGMVGDDFLNAAARAETTAPAGEVALQLRDIEDRHGRDRSMPQFSSRTLDLDLLLYDDLIINNQELALPRDDISEYAFVLQPLVDIAADVLHPVSKLSLESLLSELQLSQPTQFGALTEVSNAFLKL